MATRNTHPSIPQPASFRVTRNGRTQEMSYQQLFDAGYRLLLSKDFSESSRVFELLTSVSDRGPRAHILLAFCQSQMADYAACSKTLNCAFEGESSDLESRLHGAFVFWACGLYPDAREQLEQLIREYPQFPTLSLLLGDLLAQCGNRTQPTRLWQYALKHDRPDGAVGLIARRELVEWSKRLAKSSSN